MNGITECGQLDSNNSGEQPEEMSSCQQECLIKNSLKYESVVWNLQNYCTQKKTRQTRGVKVQEHPVSYVHAKSMWLRPT